MSDSDLAGAPAHVGSGVSAGVDDKPRLAQLRRTFVPPPPLGTSRPRDVRLTPAGRGLALLGVLLLVGAIGAFVGLSGHAQRQAGTRRALVEQGAIATGHVTRLWSSGDDRRRVAYQFTVNGRAYDGRVRVSEQRRRALQVGSPVDVRYLPADARVSDLGGPVSGGMPLVLPYVVAVAMVVAGGLCLLVIRGQRRFLSDARAAPAVVTGHASHRSQHGTHRSMTYRFPLLSGAVGSGKTATSSKPPAVGSVICVVYDPEKPSDNRLYPLSLVTPVT